MWDRIDGILQRAPHERALRFHRVELLEARRRRAAGLDLPPALAAEETRAAVIELAVPAVLGRARDAFDGRLVLVKGPEVAADYPAPRLRQFADLDLLADDAPAAQAALLEAGFQAAGDPAGYDPSYQQQPLAWPGLPLLVELHARPKWPALLPWPEAAVLLGDTEPARVGVAGVDTLPAAAHAVLLAAHAWAHEPLGRLGHLVDVAVTAARAEPGAAAALAAGCGCARMWRCTEAALDALLRGDRRSSAVALWGRHLRTARERTVLERHAADLLAPLWGLPPRAAPRGAARALRSAAGRDGDERWAAKLARSRRALADAGVSVPDHERELETRRGASGDDAARG
jgi:hypothetical protein